MMRVDQDHKMLVGLSASIFIVLSIIIGILPAYEAQKTPPLDGIEYSSAEVAPGRALYIKEGCGTCHTQFVRALPVDAPYGRGSIPEDFALEDPPLLGTQRTGPDLANIGLRQPSDVWNLIHLYNPRAVVRTSVMPGYPWYFEEKDAAQEGDVVVAVPDGYKPAGKVIVAKQEAIDIVRYLQSLKQVEID